MPLILKKQSHLISLHTSVFRTICESLTYRSLLKISTIMQPIY